MDVTDVPPMARTRVQVATLRSTFADLCLLAGPAVVRARKAGNAVLVAGTCLGDLPAAAGAVRGAALDAFSKGAGARLDAPG
jgi:hypothetical protein